VLEASALELLDAVGFAIFQQFVELIGEKTPLTPATPTLCVGTRAAPPLPGAPTAGGWRERGT
jgi:hypothetical protein